MEREEGRWKHPDFHRAAREPKRQHFTEIWTQYEKQCGFVRED